LTTGIASADEPSDALANIVSGAHRLGKFNGSVLAAVQDHVVYQAAFGDADANSNRPNEVNTAFRIASVTKGFTAVLVLQAVERDELVLDDGIGHYLPELAGAAVERVTIRHLLMHTSGIPDFGPEPAQGQGVRQAIATHLKNVALSNEPGADHKYCNVGYTLLGIILEQVSGKPYRELAASRIFMPAGMTRSYVESRPFERGARALGYDLVDGHRVPHEVDVDPAVFAGAGGIVSTAPDLLKFSRALASDKLLAPASRALMVQPNAPLGCKMMNLPGVGKLQIFQGGMTGASALLVRTVDSSRTIVLLSNQGDAPLQQMALFMMLSMQRD
jgi:CubicO group peptidase (beta-lactamase class C family)